MSGDGVSVSVHADGDTTGTLTVKSVPVVSSSMVSLSLDEFPDSHVFVASLVLSDDHEITRRSSSDIHGSSGELEPLLSVTFVLDGFEDSGVLADNSGLSIVLNSDSVGVAGSVTVNVEFTGLEESNLSSSVHNPDLSVGTSTDIEGSHGVGFPGGVLRSERSDDSGVGDGEDLTLGGDGDSLGILSRLVHGLGPSSAFVLVDLAVFTSDVDVLLEVDGDIGSVLTSGSVFPGNLVFILALGSSADSFLVVREDSGGALVEDKSHGGSSGAVVLGSETNESLGSLVEVLVDVAAFTASVSDEDGLSTDESDFETSSDLLVTEGGPEVLDVGDFTLRSLVDLDGLASEEFSVGDGCVVDMVVEVVEHESQLGHEVFALRSGFTEGDSVELGEPVGGLSLDDGGHVTGVSAGESASEVFALLSGNLSRSFTADGAFANEGLLESTFLRDHASIEGSNSTGFTSVEGGAALGFLSLSHGPVSDGSLIVTIGPVPSLGVSSTNPSILIVDAFEGHEVHDSGLLSALTDGGEVSSPSFAGLFSIVPGLLALVVDVVFERFLFDTGVGGPVDVLVLVDNEGSSSFADADLSSRSSHVPELTVLTELVDSVLFSGNEDGSFGTGSDILSRFGVVVSLPGTVNSGLFVDATLFTDNPDLSLGSNIDADSSSGGHSPFAGLVEFVNPLVGSSDPNVTVSSSTDILGLDSVGECDFLPVDTMPSEELTGGSGDPGSTVGLDGDSGSDLRADLRPGLSVESEGDSIGTDNPDGIVGTDSDILSVSGSSSPLNGLEGVALLFVGGGLDKSLVGDGFSRLSELSGDGSGLGLLGFVGTSTIGTHSLALLNLS